MDKTGLELAEGVAKEAVKEMKEDRSFAMELILNARNDAKRWFIVAMTILFMWLATIGVFVFYLSLYDYVSTSTYEANGVHALIDSDGNILSQDITPEQWEAFTKWWEINGVGQKDNKENTN